MSRDVKKDFGKNPEVAQRRREVFELRLKGLDAWQIYEVLRERKYGDRWGFETYKKDYTYAGKIIFDAPDFNKARTDAVSFYKMQIREVYSLYPKAKTVSEKLEVIRTANSIARELFRLQGIGHEISLEVGSQEEYRKLLEDYFGMKVEPDG